LGLITHYILVIANETQDQRSGELHAMKEASGHKDGPRFAESSLIGVWLEQRSLAERATTNQTDEKEPRVAIALFPS